MSDTVTVHIAGNAICVEGRVIQRCMLCGHKLRDTLGEMVPADPDGKVPYFVGWEVGALVRIDPARHCEELVEETESPHFDEQWEDCCLSLVE